MKLKELIKLDTDVDVSDDYADQFEDGGRWFDSIIAFVGPCKLTEAGQERYKDIMDLDVDVDESTAVVHIPEDEDEKMEEMEREVMLFFYAVAGYMSEDLYEEYFGKE